MKQSAKDNGGHAYPCEINDGMTLRDYFAGQALTGILSNNDAAVICIELTGGNSASEAAYVLADAMLEARK